MYIDGTLEMEPFIDHPALQECVLKWSGHSRQTKPPCSWSYKLPTTHKYHPQVLRSEGKDLFTKEVPEKLFQSDQSSTGIHPRKT